MGWLFVWHYKSVNLTGVLLAGGLSLQYKMLFVLPRQSLTMPEERLEGQANLGEEDESRDTVSDNLDVDFTTSVKKLPVIYPKGREFRSD